ncbi:MAG: hypothetical protein LBD20_01605, partial [Spirochaetaceae bacterium]|nr:hypothetical protein [Spirochaetaceae bacterium]
LSADEKVRAEYEIHQKAVRDRAWFRNDGYQAGIQDGIQQGVQDGAKKALELIKSGKTLEDAMQMLGLDNAQ